MKKEKIVTRFLNLLTDFGFHRIFGTESSKSFLISFLNEIIKEEGLITEIIYLPTKQHGFTEKERKAVFDIFCKNDKGEYFIVEMQRAKQPYFRDRSLYYASLPIQKQAPRGVWDFELKAVYVVAVLNFVIFKEFKDDKDYVVEQVSLIRERTKTPFSQKIKLIFVELPKFKKTEKELKTNFDIWLYSLKNMHSLKERPATVQGEIFEELYQIVETNNLTEEEMKEYKKSVLEYRDVRDSIILAREEALEEGIQKGIRKGRKEEKISFLQKCLQKNLPVEDIVFLTGFSKENVLKYMN